MNALELLNAIACAYILGQAIGAALCFVKDLRVVGLLIVAFLGVTVPNVVWICFSHNYPDALQQFKETIWYYPTIIFIFLPITIFSIRLIYHVFKAQTEMN